MASPNTPSRTRRWVAAVVIPLLAVVALVSWGFASPIGAGADDDFHLASEWCGGLQAAGVCEPGDDDGERLLSEDIVWGAHCYSKQPEQSAVCQGDNIGDDLTEDLQATSRGNFEGLYPPVYYFVMSAFAGENLQVSALAMRVFNALLFVGLMTTLFFLLPLRRRLTLVLPVVVTSVPLAMFYIPSNNPTGWALISAATLWIALLGYFETTGARRIALAAVAVVATVMGAGARADSAIYSGVAVAAVVALTATKSRAYLLSLVFPALLAVGALVALLSASQVSAISEGLGSDTVSDKSPLALLAGNLLDLPYLLFGSFGLWPLGWLDTGLPTLVAFCTILAFVVALSVALRFPNRRRFWVLLGLVALFAAVPMYLLLRSRAVIGEEVQPRYILPLLIVACGVALLRTRQTDFRLSRVQVLVIVGALAVANSIALRSNILRYVSGIDQDAAKQWWWHIPVPPMGMWFIGSASFGLLLLALGVLLLKSQLPAPRDPALARTWESVSAR